MKLYTYAFAFLKGGFKGLINEFGETLKDRFATDDDRMRVIEMLSFLPSKIAVPQLLKRFDLISENAIRDSKEKALVSKILAVEGKIVLPLVIKYSSKARNISWPLRIIEQLTERKEYVSILLGILSMTYPEFDDHVIKRNREIIVALQDVRDERIPIYIEPHISCRFPEIQESARRCIEAQQQSA